MKTYIHHVAAFVFTVILFVLMSIFGGSMLSPREVSRLRDNYAVDCELRQQIDTRNLTEEVTTDFFDEYETF